VETIVRHTGLVKQDLIPDGSGEDPCPSEAPSDLRDRSLGVVSQTMAPLLLLMAQAPCLGQAHDRATLVSRMALVPHGVPWVAALRA
jgi:hypothetical protein